MTQQTEALRLADELDAYHTAPHHKEAAAELRRLEHNSAILMNALMKACNDDAEMVKEIIESQGELK